MTDGLVRVASSRRSARPTALLAALAVCLASGCASGAAGDEESPVTEEVYTTSGGEAAPGGEPGDDPTPEPEG